VDRDRRFLQGTLDVLVLKTLSWAPMHGYGIASWIERCTDDALKIEDGSLYPALHRMERKSWISFEWRITENGRRAKYYALTTAGQRKLRSDADDWAAFAAAVAKVLTSPTPPAVANT
jgi:PadR family transcriptional regulator PadR